MRTPQSDRISLVRVIPALAWMLLIFVLSSQHQFPGPTGIWNDLLAIGAHLFLFGALAFLLILALPSSGRLTSRQAVLVVLAVVLYGISDEIHQSFVPGRRASVFDVVVDGIGATIVVLLWRYRVRRVRQ